MRLTLLFICLTLLTRTQAQINMEVLFTKGAELEYRTYSVKAKGFKMEQYEATRITIIVTDVKDSDNITWSYITKRGTGITNPEIDHYEKRMVISRENGKITMPVDFYFIDTSYLADKYPPGNKKSKGFNVISKTEGNSVISGNLEKGEYLNSPKTFKTSFKIRELSLDPNSPSTINETGYTLTSTTKEYKVMGKTTITTPAGTFDCYKISGTTKVEIPGLTRETTGIIYFNPEIGILKTEQEGEKMQLGYYELARLKK